MSKPSLRAAAIARAAQHSAEVNGIAAEDQDRSIHDYVAGEQVEEDVQSDVPVDDGLDVVDEQQTSDAVEEEQTIDESDDDTDDEQVEDEIVDEQDNDQDVDDSDDGDRDESVADDRDARMSQMQEELQILRAQVEQQNQANTQQQTTENEEPEQVDVAELRRSMAAAAADADEAAYIAAQEQYEQALVSQVEQRVTASVQQQTLTQQVNDAVEMFGRDYEDINSDPMLGQLAQQQFVQQVQSGVSPMVAATSIGNALREYRDGLTGQKTDPTDNVNADEAAKAELKKRRQAKKNSVVEIPSATERVDNTPAPEQREKTQTEMIDFIKQRRGKLRKVA